jgi:hypothetical protein
MARALAYLETGHAFRANSHVNVYTFDGFHQLISILPIESQDIFRAASRPFMLFTLWSKEVSAALGAVSLLIALWIRIGKGIWNIAPWRRRRISYCFFWLSVIDLLQFLNYFVINKCSNLINILATGLGWIHLCFQPFVSNLALSALDRRNIDKKRDEIWVFVAQLCAVCGFLMSLRILIPIFITIPDQSDHSLIAVCTPEAEGVCAPQTCAKTGVYHLQWGFKMLRPAYVFPGLAMHFVTMFVIPFLLGLKFAALLLLFGGPGLAMAFAGVREGETAAIWSFLAVGQAFVAIFVQFFVVRRAVKNEAAEAPLKSE